MAVAMTIATVSTAPYSQPGGADEPGMAHGGDGSAPASPDQEGSEPPLGGVSPIPGGGQDAAVPVLDGRGIPKPMLTAYQRATDILAESQPGCRLPVVLLAAIGMVETGHARGGQVDATGTTLRPILGPPLDGTGGLAEIPDTDEGNYDDDTRWDRAVGPMQIIPGTWSSWLSDGNADGRADPHNVYDASLAAGRYLCADGRDLGTESGIRDAILSYNHSASYLAIVLAWMNAYSNGTVAIPALPAQDTPRTAGPGSVLANRAATTPIPPAGQGPTTPHPGQSPAPVPPAQPRALIPSVTCWVGELLDTGIPGALLGQPAGATTEQETEVSSPCTP